MAADEERMRLDLPLSLSHGNGQRVCGYKHAMRGNHHHNYQTTDSQLRRRVCVVLGAGSDDLGIVVLQLPRGRSTVPLHEA